MTAVALEARFDRAETGAGGEGERAAATLAHAEVALAEHRYADAAAVLADERPSPRSQPQLALRALLAESRARLALGELAESAALAERARALAETVSFSAVDRAEALLALGCARFRLSEVAAALELFTLALDLCDRSCLPCDRVRVRALDWRSRCWQRRRDWQAAQSDVDRALELAEALGDRQVLAEALFQASIVAERTKQLLLARCYAEQAKELFEELGDRGNVHRTLNNLGGLAFLAGDGERAADFLKDAFRLALELDDPVAAAYAMGSLARVQLESGDVAQAESHARQAVEALAARPDHLGERANAHLVLGRALAEQGRTTEATAALRDAESASEAFGSAGLRASVWVAQGDLARRGGDETAAADLYRLAAEALREASF